MRGADPYLKTASHIDLVRLLARLDTKLGPATPTPTPGNRPSSLELAKTTANVEYARKLLAQLDTEAGAMKLQSARQRALADLMQQKHTLRTLGERLDAVKGLPELVVLDDDDDDDKEEEEEEKEEEEEEGREDEERAEEVPETLVGATTIPEPTPEPPTVVVEISAVPPPRIHPSPPPPPAPAQSSEPTSTLRNRSTKQTNPATSTSTGNSLSPSQPDSLFGPHHPSTLSTTATTSRLTHDDLTASLVSMATQLRLNSTLFAQSLEDEKPLLDEAGMSIEKNATNMEGTGRKLKDMEKKSLGFLERFIVLGLIAALVLVGFLVLMGPKILR